MRPRTIALAASLAAAAALAATPIAAEAKVWLDVGGRSVRWGDRVSTRVPGCHGSDCGVGLGGIAVYVAPGRPGTGAPKAPPRVGRLTPAGRLTFQVPRLAPGRYHLETRMTFDGRRQWVPASEAFVVRR
jgi:hypothetical protein